MLAYYLKLMNDLKNRFYIDSFNKKIPSIICYLSALIVDVFFKYRSISIGFVGFLSRYEFTSV